MAFKFLTSGNDLYTHKSQTADWVFGSAGNDTITSDPWFGTADTIDGGTGNDVLKGDKNDVLIGGNGDDILDGGVMKGGKGNDEYRWYSSRGTMQQCIVEDPFADGGLDTVVVMNVVNGATYALWGALDAISVNNTTYSVRLLGDVGNNTLWGGQGGDTIDGGTGHDALYGGGGRDDMTGGNGNDSLYGGAGDDWIYGGNGNDELNGKEGNDLLAGGAGNDAYYADQGDFISEALGGGVDTVYFSGTYHVLADGIENFRLISSGDATAIGNGLANKLEGNLGNDRLEGRDGKDSMTGGGGNDIMDGGNDADVLNGQDGADSLVGGAGNDSLFGGWQNDTLSGGAGSDSLDGGTENDTLRGESGYDTLLGGVGNDVLYGGAAADTLFGNEGNDKLYGGEGVDQLYGGFGADRFVYTNPTDSQNIMADAIMDFQKGVDKIDFSPMDPWADGVSYEHFYFSGSSQPMFPDPGAVWVVESMGNSFVRADVNGDSAFDIQIQVVGVTGLTASDFIL